MDVVKKVDRRIARTRRSLRKAMIELILEKGYDGITIRDLTRRADIGYATFFRHYKNKDDLLERVLVGMVEDLAECLRPEPTIKDQVLAMCRHIDEREELFRAAFSVRRSNPAAKVAWERMGHFFLTQYEAREKSEIPLAVSINHMMQTVWDLTRWWLQQGERYSPEEMAKIQTQLVFKVGEHVALRPRSGRADTRPRD